MAARDDWRYCLTESQQSDLKRMAAQVRRGIGDNPNALLETTREGFDLGECT